MPSAASSISLSDQIHRILLLVACRQATCSCHTPVPSASPDAEPNRKARRTLQSRWALVLTPTWLQLSPRATAPGYRRSCRPRSPAPRNGTATKPTSRASGTAGCFGREGTPGLSWLPEEHGWDLGCPHLTGAPRHLILPKFRLVHSVLEKVLLLVLRSSRGRFGARTAPRCARLCTLLHDWHAWICPLAHVQSVHRACILSLKKCRVRERGRSRSSPDRWTNSSSARRSVAVSEPHASAAHAAMARQSRAIDV